MKKEHIIKNFTNQKSLGVDVGKNERAFASAAYAWQVFMIDFYRRAKSHYKIDFDSYLVVMIVMSHVINEKSKTKELLHKDANEFFAEFSNLEPGTLGFTKRKIGIANIANILDLPDETARRKIQNLIKLKILEKTKEDGIILGPNFAEGHSDMGNATAKNFGTLIRSFHKAGIIELALDMKI